MVTVEVLQRVSVVPSAEKVAFLVVVVVVADVN